MEIHDVRWHTDPNTERRDKNETLAFGMGFVAAGAVEEAVRHLSGMGDSRNPGPVKALEGLVSNDPLNHDFGTYLPQYFFGGLCMNMIVPSIEQLNGV
ncbi:MAG: hypothetical protein ACMG6E_00300, partial [Candidatus Roizmanbacteria bacterium]